MFDVDGTLIGSIRSDVLRPRAEQLLTTLHAQGATLVLWSAGGAEYAQRMLAQFDLDHLFDAFYDKGDRDEFGIYQFDHFAPAHLPGTLVDDFPDEVPQMVRVIGVRQFLGGNPHERGMDHIFELLEQA